MAVKITEEDLESLSELKEAPRYWEQKEAEPSPAYTELDKVNYTLNEQESMGTNPEEGYYKASQAEGDGSLSTALGNQAGAEVNASMSRVPVMAEQVVKGTNDPREAVQQLQAMESVQNNAKSIADNIQHGVFSNASSDLIKAAEERRQRYIKEVGEKQLEELSAGASFMDIAKKIVSNNPIKLSMKYSPISLVAKKALEKRGDLTEEQHNSIYAFSVYTGVSVGKAAELFQKYKYDEGGTLERAIEYQHYTGVPIEEAMKEVAGTSTEDQAWHEATLFANLFGVFNPIFRVAGIEGMSGLRAAGAGNLAKMVGREAYYESMAGGFMTVADTVTDNQLATTVSALVGPAATTLLFTATRKGLAFRLAKMKSGNPNLYDSLKKTVDAAKDQKFGRVAREVMDDIDNGRISFEGESFVETSPFANTVPVGKSEVQRLENVITAALNPKNSGIKKASQTALGTGNATHTTLIPDTEALKEGKLLLRNVEGHTNLAKNLVNAQSINKVIGDHAYFDDEFAKKGQDILYLNMNVDTGELMTGNFVKRAVDKLKRPSQTPLAKGVRSKYRVFMDKAEALVSIPTHLRRLSQEHARNSKSFLNHVTSKLDKKQAAEWDQILRNGTENSRVYKLTDKGLVDPKSGKIITADEGVIDAWQLTREYLDWTHYSFNKAFNRDLKATGHEMLDDSIVIKEATSIGGNRTLADGRVYNKAMLEDGSKLYQVMNPKNPKDVSHIVLTPEQIASRVKELDENLITLSKQENFLPLVYEPETAKYLVTAVDLKSGKVKTVAAGASKKEAEEVASELTKRDPKRHYLSHNRGAEVDLGEVDVGFNGEFLNTMRNSNETVRKAVIDAMKKSDQFDDAAISLVEGVAAKVNYGGQPFRRRGNLRLRDIPGMKEKLKELPEASVAKLLKETEVAPIKPSKEALADYAQKMANRIPTYEYNHMLEREFVGAYGDVLEGGQWNSPVKTNVDDHLKSKAVEAIEIQKHLHRIYNIKSQEAIQTELQLQAKLVKAADSKTKLGRYLKPVMYNALSSNKIVSNLKTWGAHSAFMFNESQFVVQQTAMTFALGKHLFTDPTVSAAALRDTHRAYVEGFLVRHFGGTPTGEAKKMLDLIERTGFNAMQAPDILDGTMSVGKFRTRLGQKFVDTGYIPMRTGENIARSVAFFAEYRAMESAIKKGLRTDLKLDSDTMLMEVANRAERIAGNFTSLNRSDLTREGFRSVVAQFMDFPIIASEIMFGKAHGLTRTEKAGVWMAGAGAFGLEYIPFLWDGLDAAQAVGGAAGVDTPTKADFKKNVEILTSEFADVIGADEQFAEFTNRLVQRGAIAALTEDQIALSNRASLAAMTPRFLDTMDMKDFAGPGFNAFISVIGGTVNTIDDLLKLHDSGQLYDVEALARVARINYTKVAAIRNKAAAIGEDGAYIDKRGNKVVDNMTEWQRWQFAMGIRPYEVVEEQERSFDAYKLRKKQDEEIYNAVDAVFRLPAGPARTQALAEGAASLEDNPYMFGKFMKYGMKREIGSRYGVDFQRMQDDMEALKRGY